MGQNILNNVQESKKLQNGEKSAEKVQKERDLENKIKIWDSFFSKKRSKSESGGPSKEEGPPKNEKGRENEPQLKPNQIPRKNKFGEDFKGVQDSPSIKRANKQEK